MPADIGCLVRQCLGWYNAGWSGLMLRRFVGVIQDAARVSVSFPLPFPGRMAAPGIVTFEAHPTPSDRVRGIVRLPIDWLTQDLIY